ncbi:DUF5060 domain-containing protein [Rapidithrix thailandica]|uniref:DUF5060 domain-containing protein n=1 Tax=Rapidithrix thailandica TaxID=413964 RepID=A0AAW9SLL1_9BACT
MKRLTILLYIFSCVVYFPESKSQARAPSQRNTLHLYEVKEITLYAKQAYQSPYTEVECWVDLTGPGFQKRIYGFWNGGNEFRVRVVATAPGKWTWRSGSNQNDEGLNQQFGTFKALDWKESDKQINYNRRGFLRPTANGHALEYADGTPYFMIGDTWWAASTWRFPFKGIQPDPDYQPKEGISFEEALAFRKKQGYNTIAMIACFPNWKADGYSQRHMNADSVYVRQAWKKNGQNTAKDMHDEEGNMPFAPWDKSEVIADFNQLNPEYFQNLDKKIQYLHQHGFVTFLETVRRDHGPSWKKYFDWPETFVRYVQYIFARYGAYNIIFTGIHLDWITLKFGLSAETFNDALKVHYQKYGGLPYGQPHTILIYGSTYDAFGHGDNAPWLTMHSVGNKPRDHRIYPMIEKIYHLSPPYPAANLEPYYPGLDSKYFNIIAGERPEVNSQRDNYFGRAQMYGSVLSGGLAGHMYGSGGYDGNTTGEPKHKGDHPYIWEALKYSSAAQMPYLGKFILSEGKAYQNCTPQRQLLLPCKAPGAPEDGLDGWAFFLVSPAKKLGFLYFENQSEIPLITELVPEKKYSVEWFNPITGQWLPKPTSITTDPKGNLQLIEFPGQDRVSRQDWCLKIKLME